MEKILEIYFDRLWPICRSITGNGLRKSFKILQEIIPLKLHEVPSGTKVFDWEIPNEWNISDAYIISPKGKKIAEFKKNNLHIVGYSAPVNKKVSFSELDKHLFYKKDLPRAVPYITSYYKKNWGFCLSYNQYKKLSRKGKYKVYIDSSLKKGSLTYGDFILKGRTDREILFSTYLCHPSMANNELSGPLVLAFLYKKISQLKNRKYTYRFVIVPETIGAIAYLHEYGKHLKENLAAGYVLTCCGDTAPFTYKMSKHENSLADRAAIHVLKYENIPHSVVPFSVGGSDERQYCSPGFNLPVGSLMRSMYKTYKEYHTSLDNKAFISFKEMEKTIDVYFKIVRTIEMNEIYKCTVPYCEPNLGKRNMYPSSVNPNENFSDTLSLLHFLTWCDGKHDLIEIAEKINSSALRLESIVKICKKKKLI